VPWDRAVPFVIDQQGRVRLVTAIMVVAPDGARKRVDVPRARGAPELVVPLPRA
jgi:hypothetical protein